MIALGIRECSVDEIHPALQQLLADKGQPSSPPLLCIEKRLGRELSAFILTQSQATRIDCVLDASGKQAVKHRDTAPLRDVLMIAETQQSPSMIEREYCINLVGRERKTPLISFPFMRKDSAYQKFLKALIDMVRKAG